MKDVNISVVFYFLRGLARLCFKSFSKIIVEGIENIPPYGPLIVVCNHVSYNDPPYVAAIFPRPVFFLGKKELFGKKIIGTILKKVNVIPLDRSAMGISGLKSALRLLGKDQVMVVFPEGSRSRDGSLKKGQKGVSFMALKSESPIIPIAITGTDSFPVWRLWMPLKTVHIKIGTAFTLPVIDGHVNSFVLASITDMIMNRLSELLPADKKGVYPTNGLS
jgi:1-acyl-sn-glycerol-3-phosphate acyltransferase